MKNTINDYLASKVIEDIRHKRVFDASLVVKLNEAPLIDSLRVAVQKKDVSILLKMADSKNTAISGLALGLLQKYNKLAVVKSFLVNKSGLSKDWQRNLPVMCRRLDDVNVDVSVHEETYKLITDNIRAFLSVSPAWFGGVDKVLSVSKARLVDPKFPRTKDWFYLCMALGSSDRASVKKLLKAYKSNKNKFISRVAKELLQRFFA